MNTGPCNFKQLLQNKMEIMAKQNELDTKGAFVSYEYLTELFTKNNLERQFRTVFSGQEPETLDRLYEKIQKGNSKKLYATLVLIDQEKLLLELEEFDDTMFDADKLSMTAQAESHSTPTALSSLRRIPALSTNVADDLYKNQWSIPPRLYATPHYMFPIGHFVFPFESRPREVSHGSYGHVYEVTISKDHLDVPNQYNQSGLVYKKISKADFPGRNGWNYMLREVKTLRERQHPHIMPLLTSFGTGHEKRIGQDEYLYMISPRADKDMKMWMEQHELDRTENIQEKEIHDAIEGIVSAVAYIHSEFKGKRGFHHDLKPRNILRYVHKRQPDEETVIWKLCDFGHSNLKRFDDTGTRLGETTLEYAPPEFRGKNDKYGRSFDIFPLGCILLELSTVLHYGWQDNGLAELRRRRVKNQELTLINDEQYSGSSGSGEFDISYRYHLNVVNDWISDMHEHCSNTVFGILNLVREMLVVDSDQRILAWEAEIDIFELLRPNAPRAEIFEKLVEVVQVSNKPINGLDTRHNPLTRAKRAERGECWYTILRGKYWLDHIPEATSDIAERTRPDKIFSTIPVLDNPSPLYGRNELDEQISQGFSQENAVALYGMGGIGKSYLAYNYAFRYKEGLERERRHTFWIQAGSISNIDESCRKIAKEVGIPLEQDSSPSALREDVKKWLEDTRNGRWFLVIDELDLETNADIIATLRPGHNSGQILYTTRDRGIMKTFVSLKNRAACIKVESLETEASLKIFEHHVDRTLASVDDTITKELVRQCGTPLVVKLAAEYMTTADLTSAEVQDSMKSNKFEIIDEMGPAGIEFLLRPLLRLKESKTINMELRLLCLLAAFNKDGVAFSLICMNFEQREHARVRTMLSNLVNSCYLKKGLEHQTYCMHEIIQLGLLHWMREPPEEQLGIPQQHERALAMLYKAYISDCGTKHAPEASKIQRDSYLWKLPYMPHFERFSLFTKNETSGLEDFWLRDTAVKAIITFSRVYLDQNRHDDAIGVLEFALEHHQGTQKFNIGKSLFSAYISRPSRRDAPEYWKRSEKLLQDLTTDAKGNQCQLKKLDLKLTRVKLYRESVNYPRAWAAFKPLQVINLRVVRGQPLLPESFYKQYGLTDSKKTKRLCVQVRQEEGNMYMARGQHLSERKRSWCAKRDWKAAREAFQACEAAIRKWFPAESKWITMIQSDIADANTKIGTPELLDKAEEIIRKRLDGLQKGSNDNQQRIWDVKCKLAAVSMKRGQKGVEMSIEILRDVLGQATYFYQGPSRYGEDGTLPRKYAYQLRKAYIKAGRLVEASQLEQDYPKMQRMKHERQPPATIGLARAVTISFASLVLFCYLAYSYTRRWKGI